MTETDQRSVMKVTLDELRRDEQPPEVKKPPATQEETDRDKLNATLRKFFTRGQGNKIDLP